MSQCTTRWPFWAMLRKEFIQMRRDRLTLGMMIGIPAIQLALFGFAIRTEVRHLPTVVLDEARTPESRQLVATLVNSTYFEMVGEVHGREEIAARIGRGDAAAAVIIPHDFTRDLKRGRGAKAQVIVDAADPLSSQSALQGAVAGGPDVPAFEQRHPAAPDRSELRVRPWYNPMLAARPTSCPASSACCSR